jgi:hypothetical protein
MKAEPDDEFYYVKSHFEWGDGRREEFILGTSASGHPYRSRSIAERRLREQHGYGRTDATLLVGKVTWTEERAI